MKPSGSQSLSDRVLMARVSSFLFAGGALIAFVGVLLPHPMVLDETAVLAIGATATAGALVMLGIGPRLPALGFHLVQALSTLMITVGVYAVGGVDGDALGVEMLYLWPALYTGYFLGRRALLVQLALIGLSYGALLIALDLGSAMVARWTVTLGMVSVAGLVFTRLKERSVREIDAREETASLLQATLESTADGILVVDPEGRMVSWNSRFVKMWGIPPEIEKSRDDDRAIRFVLDQLRNPDRFVGKIRELYNEREAESYDIVEFIDGRVVERYSKPRLAGGQYAGRVWSFRDVTERRRFESQLQHLADHDFLTDLYNRRRFDQELERETGLATRYGDQGAVVLLDLDNFKYVNDTLGHAAGDVLLQNVAIMLRGRLRDTDVLARLGGDEFAVVLPRTAPAAAQARAEELVQAVRDEPIAAGRHRIRITTSAGLVLFKGGQDTASELLVAADLAMYDAKEAGRDRVSVHSPFAGPRTESRARLTWSQRIRSALDDGGFSLYAQPIRKLESGEVKHHELLIRMRGENGELIMPGAFLGTAERFGMIKEVDRWVVRRAIGLIAEQARHGQRLRLAVNLSGRSLVDCELPELIRSEVESSGIDPSALTFEATETIAIVNMQQARRFAESLSALGCHFALDDFGSGFGSFYYLKHLPVDLIKIDGDFIRELPRSETDQLVVKSMVAIARGLDLRTIAEFAADEETLAMLRGYGIDYAQGAGVGSPRPVEEILEAPPLAASAG